VGLITLLTDFGTSDGYVAAMKGVILSQSPRAQLVDVAHDISPGAICSAAYVLYACYRYFPPGTIHLVVVDPGVGSERRALIVRAHQQWFVAPDNGVLSLICDGAQVETYQIDRPKCWLKPVSATFHGRDVFAPVAAKLAGGVPPTLLGSGTHVPKITVRLGVRSRGDGTLLGSVIHIDRFGNVITSARADDVPRGAEVRIGEEAVCGVVSTFSDVASGEMLAYVGSSGLLELAIRDGNAAVKLGVKCGDPVEIAVSGASCFC